MINPMEKEREGSTAQCKTLLNSVALAEKQYSDPEVSVSWNLTLT